MRKSAKLLITSTLLVAMLAGCNDNSGGSTGETTATTKASDNATTTSADGGDATTGGDAGTSTDGVDTSEHVVITYMTTGNIPTNQTDLSMAEVNKKLTERVNAEVKIHWIEWTDYTTNYNLTLASQDGTIDLVGTATDWLDAWPNTKNGAFMPLSEEMLQTYAPQTWARIPAEHWDLCRYNGEIFFIPEDNYAQWVNHGFQYRMDWAKEAGLENGCHSWEDMQTYFQYIKDNKEGVIPWDAQGSGSTIYDALAGGWLASHSDTMGIEGLRVGLFFGESRDNPYKLSRYYLEGDELVNFAKTMKEWNDAGFWREDVLNNNIETREEFYVGRTGADQHHTETFYGTVRPRMDRDQPGSDVGFFWFGEETKNITAINPTHGAAAVAAKSKNPERTLMVYDLLCNDADIYNNFHFGIEGTHYTKDGEYLVRPEGYVEADNGVSVNFWWGRNDDIALKDGNRAWGPYEELTSVYDQVKKTYAYGKVVFDLDPISSQLDNLSNVYSTYMAQIAFGKQADPVAYVEEFRNQLRAAGYEDVIANVEAQLAAVYG